MPKCPFCGKKISSMSAYIQGLRGWRYDLLLDKLHHKFLGEEEEQDERGAICICPECGRKFPFFSWRMGDFLREKYIILRSDDPEIKRKRDYVLYRGRVYKIIEERKSLLHLEFVENELVADILKTDLEGG